MAPDQVWDVSQVCVLLLIVRSLLNPILPVIPRAPLQEKGFPLFDELAYLCDDVLATGVGLSEALDGSGDLDGEGQWRKRMRAGGGGG